MKGVLCLLTVAFSCQSLLGKDISSDGKYEKPTGGLFVQGELPKHDIAKDKIRTHTSTKVNTTRVRIEESLEISTQKPESLDKAESEAQDEPETEPQAKPKVLPQNEPEAQPHDESQDEPQVETVAITDNSFLPCSYLPCPFNKKTDKHPKLRPDTVKNSNPKARDSTDQAYEEYQLSLEFYHSLSFQLLLISLFCLTMIVLLTSAFLAMYISKNGLGLRRFRKLENRDCGLNKYNF